MIDERERMADLLYEAQYRHMSVEETVDLLQDYGVIYPPCKVGDVVYSIGWGDNNVHEDRVSLWSYDSKGESSWFQTTSTDQCTPEDIGRTVFFTREAAERALKERDT